LINFKKFRFLDNLNDSFKILLFGWSNKKFHSYPCWETFINFKFRGPNLKIEIRGQFVNFKKIRGQIIIF